MAERFTFLSRQLQILKRRFKRFQRGGDGGIIKDVILLLTARGNKGVHKGKCYLRAESTTCCFKD